VAAAVCSWLDGTDPAPPRGEHRLKRFALFFLGLASPLLLASLLTGAVRSFITLSVAFSVGLMALGAAGAAGREGAALKAPEARVAGRRFDPTWGTLLLLLLLLEGSFFTMLALLGRASESAWLLGLPLATVVQLVGLWLLPVAVVPAAYAWSFGRGSLTSEGLSRFRARAGLPGDPPSQ
jgi:hypothetical protein